MANERLPERSIPDRSPGHAFIANRSCRLPPAHQGMKIRSCDLVWRVGTVDSATPHPDPSGGQAPALHFLIPPSTIGLQFGTFRRRRAGTWRAHPGSESGTCFRSNRSPAHQGMKIRSCDLVSASWPPHAPLDSPAIRHPIRREPAASRGHFLSRIGVYKSSATDFRRRRQIGGTEGDWRAHPTGSESGAPPRPQRGTCFRANRSCRLPPAHQGMKIRSCDLVWRVGTVDSATPHPDPSGGQAPALHFLIWAQDPAFMRFHFPFVVPTV